MPSRFNFSFLRMGVMNITPNSFSDGGELDSLEKISAQLTRWGKLDAIDLGAESTAPMNRPITADEEWQRLRPLLPLIKNFSCPLSLDTYHPETMFKMARYWRDSAQTLPLIWNDVSGKFDDDVREFLQDGRHHHYIFCHNLAPVRELSGSHMDYLSQKQGPDFILELVDYFRPYAHPQVIFDPCLGFSKTYEQNWFILQHMKELQEKCAHSRWLLGFSRKSFLRKKYGMEKVIASNKAELDRLHVNELAKLSLAPGEVWIRTHRPELL